MFNDKRKCLLAGAGLILIMFCGYFYFAFKQMDKAILKEKISDKQFYIDLICDSIDAVVEKEGNWDNYDYDSILHRAVLKIDSAKGIYAGLFDSNLNSLTEEYRTFEEVPFDPKDYPGVIEDIKNNIRGEAVVFFNKEGVSNPYDMHLYYRWVPTDKKYNNKLLIIVGVSKYSIDASIEDWVTYGAGVLIIVSLIFVAWAIVLYAGLVRYVVKSAVGAKIEGIGGGKNERSRFKGHF